MQTGWSAVLTINNRKEKLLVSQIAFQTEANSRGLLIDLTCAIETTGPDSFVVHIWTHHGIQNLLLFFSVVDLLVPKPGVTKHAPEKRENNINDQVSNPRCP